MVKENITINKKILQDSIIEVIKTCYDPEIPVDIYALGLIYGVEIDDEANVEIEMTLTSPNCPVAESLPLEVETLVKTIPEVKSAKVNIVFEPTWTMDMVSEEAKLELGLM